MVLSHRSSVYAEERVYHADEVLVFLGVRDARRKLVYVRVCVTA